MRGQSKQGILAGLFLIVSIFLPDLHIRESLPAIQINNFLIPFLAYYTLKDLKNLKFRAYYYLLLLFCFYIILTIGLNNRWHSGNDYFEIYKVLKFGIIIAFYSLTPFMSWKKVIIPAGLVLGVLNLIHFSEFKPFNDFIYAFYNGGLNLVYFGKNTLMQDSSKRMVGLMGNPNMNAILFSLLSIYVLPFRYNKKHFLLFLAFITLAFMCQSRTTLVALVVVILVFLFMKFHEWNRKQIGYFAVGLILSYLVAWMLCSRFFAYNIYGNSIVNGAVLETNSVLGRLESWKFIGKMIVKNPIFGYGPNKDFFYDRNLYSENEYILYTWRYGFIGLFIYLAIFLAPIKLILSKEKNKKHLKTLVLGIALMLVSAITNNPLTGGIVSAVFAMIIGSTFGKIDSESKKELNE